MLKRLLDISGRIGGRRGIQRTNPTVCRWKTLKALKEQKIRIENPEKIIIGLADNSKPHRAEDTLEFAKELGINLVLLPPYSPDLNPIEYIWKSVKRIISHSFVKDAGHLKEIIESAFLKYAVKLSFARGWIERFISP